MGIKSFVIALLFIATVSYFIPVNNLKKNTAEKDLPLVVFEKPIMYTLDDKSVHRIIIADQAVKYEKRDEMFNANITLKNQDPTKDFNSENLKADLVPDKFQDVKGEIYECLYIPNLNTGKMNFHFEQIFDFTDTIDRIAIYEDNKIA